MVAAFASSYARLLGATRVPGGFGPETAEPVAARRIAAVLGRLTGSASSQGAPGQAAASWDGFATSAAPGGSSRSSGVESVTRTNGPRDEAPRFGRISLGAGSSVMATLEETRRALATLDAVLTGLRRDPDERDRALHDLIEAIEEDRAFLLAATVSGQAVQRPPSRFRRGEP